MLQTLQEYPLPPHPSATPERLATLSLGTGKTVVMLVTNTGFKDPRVLRSINTARRAGFTVSLVCRALPKDDGHTEEIVPSGTAVHRVARLRFRGLLERIFARNNGHPDGQTFQEPEFPNGTIVYRLPRLSCIALWRWLMIGQYKQSRKGQTFWLRPWELWILGGITWFNLHAVRKMWRLPGDLYHANDLDSLPAAVLLSKIKRAPLLYDSHELFSCQFTDASRQFQAILFGLEHWLIRHAHKTITVNYSIAETLAEWHRIPKPAVVMNCPFAVKPAQPKSDCPKSDAHSEARTGKARVIYQGWYTSGRGLEELILSAAWYDSAELYLRGYGDLEPALRSLVRERGLEGRVHFLPPVRQSELVESLVGYDVGVVPYRPTSLNNRLSLPNKVFEYLQAGLALAVSALPEYMRLVQKTGTGGLFHPDSPKDIARAINALTCDSRRLQELKARALFIGQHFTWEAQGEPRLLSCYEDLVETMSGKREGPR